MEGLEVSEVLFSNFIKDNEKFRIDSDFFTKENLHAYEKIKSKPYVLFSEIIDTLTDYHANGSYENLKKVVELLDEKSFAYMVRSTDLEKREFNEGVKFITKEAYDSLPKTKLFGGELLINKIGTPGRSYLMPTLNIPASVGMNLFMIRLKAKAKFKESFIWAFLSGKIGQTIILRKVNGTVPLTIDKEAIRTIYIPEISLYLQEKIDAIIKLSEKMLKDSRVNYNNASQILTSLFFNSPQDYLDKKRSTVKFFASSFKLTGRLDAEYYQPKYEEMVNRISAQPHARLTDLVTIQKSIEPGSDAYTDDDGLPFLRVADYDKLGISTPQKRLNSIFSNEHFEKLEALKPKKGTILFSKDGSVGEAFCLREDADFITSGAILHLSIRNKQKILPEYLTLALNSILVRTQAERDAGGSIILHWRVDEIKNVLIPLVDITTQQKISSLVQKSFSFKSESERLLEVAKRAVEIAIEQDEAAGLAYIQEQTTIQDVLAAEVHESCYSCQRIEED